MNYKNFANQRTGLMFLEENDYQLFENYLEKNIPNLGKLFCFQNEYYFSMINKSVTSLRFPEKNLNEFLNCYPSPFVIDVSVTNMIIVYGRGLVNEKVTELLGSFLEIYPDIRDQKRIRILNNF